ncbi:hypothetical protein HYALB_00010704 [Hymenoscyphus albidus]|uniref:Uncharacterized protein n=1 Tax=Hymenoscyphus albidus TaxID=595503 RepID=A0A9N9M527_9HELO|nr:hypothetical protein HYALB_00010704 [Hymenoscyphus albidus]
MPTTNPQFELPAFKPINFSLTDGTDIPPPIESPVEEKPPPPVAKPQLTANTSLAAANGSMPPPPAPGANGAAKTENIRTSVSGTEAPPLSPISQFSQKKPGSIRKFLSRKSLNQNYIDGQNGSFEDLHGIKRPESALSTMTADRSGVKAKRSSGWFRRFSSTPAQKTAQKTVVPQPQQPLPTPERKPVPRGPPPPRLPELNQLKSQIPEDDEGSLGAEDMFKNIR